MKTLIFSRATHFTWLFCLALVGLLVGCQSDSQQIATLDSTDCKGNFDHYKLSPDVAMKYIAAYEAYLEQIEIDASSPGTPALRYPKFKSFSLPECELETIANEWEAGDKVWAAIGIKEEEPSLIFEIRHKNRGGNSYFNNGYPCPPLCDFVPPSFPEERSSNCSGDYSHLKLTDEDAEHRLSAYKSYLEHIKIAQKSPAKIALKTPKFESFKLPECELQTIVKEHGPGLTAFAILGIKGNEPTLIFKVRGTAKTDWVYYDFTNPCPSTCD